MNIAFEKKLSELRKEAEREGLAAVHVALHMLHASYLQGTHKDFARHCCGFLDGSVTINPPTVSEGPDPQLRTQ